MKPNILIVCLLALLLPMTICLPCRADQPPRTDSINTSLPSSGNAQSSAHSSEQIHNLPGLSNVGRVAPGIYRGALPEKEGYETLKKLGIKTVIDMRVNGNEKAEVEAVGMKSIRIPIWMTRTSLQTKTEQVVALMADPANQPVYVHCRYGRDRTGIVVAAYRMKHQGWSLADAETDMEFFGFNEIWVNLRRFIQQYGKQMEEDRALAKSNTK